MVAPRLVEQEQEEQEAERESARGGEGEFCGVGVTTGMEHTNADCQLRDGRRQKPAAGSWQLAAGSWQTNTSRDAVSKLLVT